MIGGGVGILNASIEKIERSGDGFEVRLRRTDTSAELIVEADEVIAATGFTAPLRDLAGAGRDDVRPEQAAGADAVLGERVGAGHLLRGHDRAGLERV